LLQPKGLKGGVIYHDGRFDDSACIALIKSLADHEGVALNYCKVTGLLKNNSGQIAGVKALELETGYETELKARVVVNATGVFVDEILKMDHPVTKRTIRPSQGIHLVLDSSFLQGNSAIMIPKTTDGRVLFAIPWYDKVVIEQQILLLITISLEPTALEEEIRFILDTAGKYLTRPPKREDVRCVYAGLRPRRRVPMTLPPHGKYHAGTKLPSPLPFW
jgi:glycerol-3-phosphate dehydrogenase